MTGRSHRGEARTAALGGGARRGALVLFLCAFCVAEAAGAVPHPVPADTSRRRSARGQLVVAPSARTARRATASAPLGAGNGTLVFLANAPDASVTIDGQPVTGGIAERPLGTYHVRVTAPGRLPATAEPIITRAGQIVTIRANLPPDPAQRSAGGGAGAGHLAVSDMRPPPRAGDGLLTIAAEPGATVRLDGDSIGVTPIREYRLPAGDYYLRVTRSGFQDAEQMVTVRRGATTSPAVVMRPNSRL
jgi:hypothetical protein